MKLRKVVFWLHLTVGALAGVIIFLMSMTGVLLAFERQILAYAERDARTVMPPTPDAPGLDLDSIVANARAAVPGGAPSAVVLSASATTATTVNFGREQAVLVDPYTGMVRGKGASATRVFFQVVTDWHRWLGRHDGSREIGRAIAGACNAAFMALVISGSCLWWPRRWTRLALRTITIPSLRLRGKARDWNWHNAIGFWSAPVLLFITVTGLVISYQWAGNLIYTLTGSEPPPQRPMANPAASRSGGQGRAIPSADGGVPDGRVGRPPRAQGAGDMEQPTHAAGGVELGWAPAGVSLEALFTTAVQQAPHWRLMTIRLPQRGAAQVTVMIEEADSWHPYPRSILTLDATTAGVVKWEPFGSNNLGRTLRSWVRPVHTGEAGGFIGQCIAMLASAAGAVLVYSGLALAWRRFWQFIWRQRRPSGVAEHRDAAPSQVS